MATFRFTLIAEGPDLQTAELADALFDAGCDDALVGRADGVQYLDFDREAPSLEQAIFSAVSDIEAIDGIDVVRLADAGLVSMADIGTRTGRTRESVRLLIAGERGPVGSPLLSPIPAAVIAFGGQQMYSGGSVPNTPMNTNHVKTMSVLR